ncbi:MAG: DUF3472 domain-containing protein [Planctomycetota bacterium]
MLLPTCCRRSPFLPALLSIALITLAFSGNSNRATAADWQVPFGGNAFRTAPGPGDSGLDARGLKIRSLQDVWSIYLHVDRPAALQLSLDALVAKKTALKVNSGDSSFECVLDPAVSGPHPLGQIQVAVPGYLRLDFRGNDQTGSGDSLIRNLLVSSTTSELTLNCVRNNRGNMYYWGRRGPSVHLTWTVPRDATAEYAYSELLVPEGEDQTGSFFMANGFGEGYFGMQVNSATERRILFSVWSPFQTDNPKEIPEDQRVMTDTRGAGVQIGEFGNEGAGGQSYLVYPWKAGTTCRFLTRVQPVADDFTIYTAWFSDGTDESWRLIASFRRPKTQTSLRGFHSFLENFNPSTGHLGRRVQFSNIQIRDTSGMWHACTSARFSTDATGSQQHRLDFAGGVESGHFFLQNCGFFHSPVRPGTRFQLSAPAASNPPTLPEQPR